MFNEWLEDVARHHGTAHAVVQRETYLSFRGLLHRAGRRMQELRALGVERGMGVGILLGNVSDVLVFAVALNQLGASVVPLHPLTSARELANVAAVLPLRAIISRPGLRALEPEGPWPQDGPPPLLPTKRTRLQGSLLACALFRLDGAPPLPSDAPLVHVLPRAGGRYGAVVRSGEALAREGERLWAALDTGDRPRIGVALPLFQPFSLELLLTLVCGYGAEAHLDDDLAPRRILGRLRDTQPTLAPVTRALLRTFLSLPAPRALDPTLRLLCVDGPVERDLEKTFSKIHGPKPLGLLHRVETGTVAFESTGRAPHTLGPALRGVQVRIVGTRGAPVAEGRQGGLQVLLTQGQAAAAAGGPAEYPLGRVLSESFADRRAAGKPAREARGRGEARRALPAEEGREGPPLNGRPAESSLAEGDGVWVDTGDIASRDSKGRIRLHGRTDDQVLVGGMPVSLEEVHEVLVGHPSVAAAEITPPDGDAPSSLDGAALLRARVVRCEAVSVETLLAHMGRLLSPHKAPGTIQFVSRLNKGPRDSG